MTFLFFSEKGVPYLYFTDEEQGDIFRMPTSGGRHESLGISGKITIERPWGMAYNFVQNFIYWTDVTHVGIGRFSLDDGSSDFMLLHTGE